MSSLLKGLLVSFHGKELLAVQSSERIYDEDSGLKGKGLKDVRKLKPADECC